jgi:micrococcal nuclease
VLVAALLVLGSCSRASAPPGDPQVRGEALVTRVVDGDTVEVELEGRELDVRLIGIDTPETVKPGAPVECFGPEASAFTTRRLEGNTVRLEFDVELVDPFDRTLAYVWVGDELFNETLVREGYALVTTFPPNVRYVDRFVSAQRSAREEGLGLWSACAALVGYPSRDHGELGRPG